MRRASFGRGSYDKARHGNACMLLVPSKFGELFGECLWLAYGVRHRIVPSAMVWENSAAIPMGTWCSGITSASHAEGPGFKSQCVHC